MTNKGMHWKLSEEVKSRISLAKKGKMPKNISILIAASISKNWKGDDVGYRALHCWVKVRLGKASYCENDSTHTSTRYHWANISGDYKRDLIDWRQLCPSCNKIDGIPKHKRFLERRLFT